VISAVCFRAMFCAGPGLSSGPRPPPNALIRVFHRSRASWKGWWLHGPAIRCRVGALLKARPPLNSDTLAGLVEDWLASVPARNRIGSVRPSEDSVWGWRQEPPGGVVLCVTSRPRYGFGLLDPYRRGGLRHEGGDDRFLVALAAQERRRLLVQVLVAPLLKSGQR
jgi:hypothetical protein